MKLDVHTGFVTVDLRTTKRAAFDKYRNTDRVRVLVKLPGSNDASTLKKFRKKKHLFLDVTIDSAAVLKDFDVLKNFKHAKYVAVDFCGDWINASKYDMRPLFNFLESFKKICWLTIFGSPIKVLNMAHFTSLERVKEAWISDINFGLESLDGFKCLEYLRLERCKKLKDFGFLNPCQKLIDLDFSGCEVKSYKGIEKLKLKKLALISSSLKDHEYVYHMKTIEALVFASNKTLQSVDVEISHSNVKKINFGSCRGLKSIKNLLLAKNLEILNIGECPGINAQMISELSSHSKLKLIQYGTHSERTTDFLKKEFEGTNIQINTSSKAGTKNCAWDHSAM